jgi:hypothetical protein
MPRRTASSDALAMMCSHGPVSILLSLDSSRRGFLLALAMPPAALRASSGGGAVWGRLGGLELER